MIEQHQPALSTRDREAISFLLQFDKHVWAVCPPCFTPSIVTVNLAARGLVELRYDEGRVGWKSFAEFAQSKNGRWTMRLTDLGRFLLQPTGAFPHG